MQLASRSASRYAADDEKTDLLLEDSHQQHMKRTGRPLSVPWQDDDEGGDCSVYAELFRKLTRKARKK